MLTGIRTEEARALQWSHVVAWVQDSAQWHPVTQAGFDHDKLAVYVWRSVRAGGDTKTQKSRGTLEVPDEVARALRQHHTKQAARRLRTGETWQDYDLVFCTPERQTARRGQRPPSVPFDHQGGRRGGGLDPARATAHLRVDHERQRRPHRKIADLVGHRAPIVTQTVYWHQLRPVIETGATAMNAILNHQKNAGSG